MLESGITFRLPGSLNRCVGNRSWEDGSNLVVGRLRTATNNAVSVLLIDPESTARTPQTDPEVAVNFAGFADPKNGLIRSNSFPARAENSWNLFRPVVESSAGRAPERG